MTDSAGPNIHSLAARIDRVEKDVKERETSFLRATKTLVEDLRTYQQDDTKEFPASAILGVLYAYLRPKIVVAIAGLGAVALGAMQLILLYQQNQLIDNQSIMLQNQMRTDQLSAITSVLSELTTQEQRAEILVPMLGEFQDQSAAILIKLARSDSLVISELAIRSLAEGADHHSVSEQTQVHNSMAWSLVRALGRFVPSATNEIVGDSPTDRDVDTLHRLARSFHRYSTSFSANALNDQPAGVALELMILHRTMHHTSVVIPMGETYWESVMRSIDEVNWGYFQWCMFVKMESPDRWALESRQKSRAALAQFTYDPEELSTAWGKMCESVAQQLMFSVIS